MTAGAALAIVVMLLLQLLELRLLRVSQHAVDFLAALIIGVLDDLHDLLLLRIGQVELLEAGR